MKILYNNNNNKKKTLPRLIHLSASKFLYPYLSHKSTNASTVLHKELHFSPLLSFFTELLGSRLKTRPRAPPQPQRRVLFGTVCQSGKRTPCSVLSAHIITQCSRSPLNFHSQKASPNLIILVFHQVERFGRWRIGI